MSPTSLMLLFALMIILAAFANWGRLFLLSLTPARFRKLFGKAREEQDEDWLRDAESYLLSMLVVNNAAKLASPLVLFAWLGAVAPSLAMEWKLAVALAASVLCVLLCAEGLPRVIVNTRPKSTPRLAMLPFFLLVWTVYPFRFALQRVSLLLGKLLAPNRGKLTLWPRHAARSPAWGGHEEHVQLEENEKVLISSIYNMTETIVREIMVPRVDMHCLDETSTLASVRDHILETGHSRFPVYSGNIDHITGLFLAKNLLRYSTQEEMTKTAIKEITRPISFVPETKNISHLLREFQQKRQHMAVVVDEYGNTAGLVTIEDLLEEIVGEIEDEFDREQKLFVESKDGGYVVNAKMSISDVEEELKIKLPDNSEYDTIGGFVVATVGKVPQEGETFLSNGVVVTVLEADDRCVRRVKLVPSPEGEKSATKKGEGE